MKALTASAETGTRFFLAVQAVDFWYSSTSPNTNNPKLRSLCLVSRF